MNIIFRKDIISLVNFFLILDFKMIHKQSDLVSKVLNLKRIVEGTHLLFHKLTLFLYLRFNSNQGQKKEVVRYSWTSETRVTFPHTEFTEMRKHLHGGTEAYFVRMQLYLLTHPHAIFGFVMLRKWNGLWTGGWLLGYDSGWESKRKVKLSDFESCNLKRNPVWSVRKRNRDVLQ